MTVKALSIACLASLLTTTFSLQSQTEVFDPSNRWRVGISCYFGGPIGETSSSWVSISGDTLIDSTMYRVVLDGHRTLGYAHQSGEQVYFIPAGADTTDRMLLYDFSLQVGDTFRTVFPEDSVILVVTEVDSITLNDGSSRKSLRLDYVYPYPGLDEKCYGQGVTWYDGLGSDIHPVYYEPICFECAYWIECFSQDTTNVYGSCRALSVDASPQYSGIRVYPVPVQDRLFLEDPENQVERLVIRDLRGTVLYSASGVAFVPLGSYASGVYVVSLELRNGDRVVRKVVKE